MKTSRRRSAAAAVVRKGTMKEYPIAFSPEMILALRRENNPKTQTRRVAKFPSWVKTISQVGPWVHGEGVHPKGSCENEKCAHLKGTSMFTIRSPYGEPGDRLWVREGWSIRGHGRVVDPVVVYQADRDGLPLIKQRDRAAWSIFDESIGRHRPACSSDDLVKIPDGYRHARFMFRWASRMTLEVLKVRCERLQNIATVDALGEGCQDDPRRSPRIWYRNLWDKLNGDRGYSWTRNPFVFVYEFRRIVAPIEFAK